MIADGLPWSVGLMKSRSKELQMGGRLVGMEVQDRTQIPFHAQVSGASCRSFTSSGYKLETMREKEADMVLILSCSDMIACVEMEVSRRKVR